MDKSHGEVIQTFPQTMVNITRDDLILTIVLAPGLSMTYGVNEAMMNDIVAKWLETRKQVKKELALIQDVKKSRIN